MRLLGSVSFLYLKHNDVYILFVTRQNANAMLAMAFMKQVCPLPPGSWQWRTMLVGAANHVRISSVNCSHNAAYSALRLSDVLMQLVSLFTAYFAEFTEAAIKNNFVLIYELLDEASALYCYQQHTSSPCPTPMPIVACPCTADLLFRCWVADARLRLATDGRPSCAEAVHIPEGPNDAVSSAKTRG